MLRTNTFVNAPNRLSSKCTWATWTNLNTENIKFSKDCFSNGMRVTSYGVKVGDYYLVQYSPMGYDNCTEYNVTRIEKYFEFTLKDGFQRDLNYQLKVQAMQGNTILWRHTLNIGSCPFTGYWSSWSSWDSCYCKEITKPRTRIRHCVQNTDPNKRLSLHQCEGDQPIEPQSCYLTCRPFLDETTDTTIQPKSAASSQNVWTNQIGVIFGGSATFCITLIALMMFFRGRRKKKKFNQSVDSIEGTDDDVSVYISHYSNSLLDEEEILSLVHYLMSLDLQCHVDLLNQVEINNMGGLPNWIPEHILSVKKILMVISKEYLQALNLQGVDENDAQVCKIHAEFGYIKSILYHSCTKASPRLVLLFGRGVNFQDLPNELQGLPYCYYPKRFKIPEDENCRKLLGMLKDAEPLKLSTDFISRASSSFSSNDFELAETVL
ncbi:uncharacterized protein [Clytia hemisphaerica]